MAGFNFDFMSKGVDGICWTNTPYTKEALETLPSIEMYGFEQQWSSAITNVDYWLARADPGNAGNPYSNLYSGTPKTKYRLPYFTEYHHGISQSWEPNNGPIGDAIKSGLEVVETAAKAVLPAAGIVYPKSYAGSQPATYTFTFYLINTNAGNGNELLTNINLNRTFLHQFIEDNLHNQNSALSVTPPLIYEVYIPGVRWAPAAIVSSLTVNNKGSLNNKVPGIVGDYIVPDAWEVTVGITELINESKQLWKDAIKGGFANVTTKIIVAGGGKTEALANSTKAANDAKLKAIEIKAAKAAGVVGGAALDTANAAMKLLG